MNKFDKNLMLCKNEKERERAMYIAQDFVNQLNTLDAKAKGECLTEVARLLAVNAGSDRLTITVNQDYSDLITQIHLPIANSTVSFEWVNPWKQ